METIEAIVEEIKNTPDLKYLKLDTSCFWSPDVIGTYRCGINLIGNTNQPNQEEQSNPESNSNSVTEQEIDNQGQPPTVRGLELV